MSEVWFTSDTHFFHESMITNQWRPFGSLVEMHEVLIEEWNSRVRKDDQVWHLGDFGMARDSTNLSVLPLLNGRKHLIAGNHDSVWPGHRHAYKQQAKYLWAGFESVQAFARRKVAGKDVMLSHFPYVGDHTEGDRYDEYRLQNKGLFLLHGHVHDAWQVFGRQINVGVDVWQWGPVSLSQIADLIGDCR